MSTKEPISAESFGTQIEDIKRSYYKLLEDGEAKAAKRLAEDRERWAAAEKRFAEDKERWAIAEKRFAEDKERWAIAERQRKHLNQLIGGIGRSLGEQAEHFFIRALRRSLTFGGIRYHDMTPRMTRIRPGELEDEFDIVLHNGSAIAIIEVKYKFRLHDLHVLCDRKVKNFRVLFHEYADKTLYLGIAGCSFEQGVIEEAKKLGIGIMQKDGKNVEYDDENLKTF